MALSVTSNFSINAAYAANNMRNSQSLMGKSINRISSGLRAPKPADDALSYVGGNKLKADSAGYSVLSTGIQDLAAKHNMADSVLSDVGNALLDLKAKAIAYSVASASNDGEAKTLLENDAETTISALSSMMSKATYKGSALFGTSQDSAYFTLDGTNPLSLAALDNSSLITVTKTLNLSSVETDIKSVTNLRAQVGSNLSALETISNYLSDLTASADAAYSAVTEVDMAREMTKYVKNNVQSQAAQAMVAQANQGLAQVLNLLQV